jgi:large subunit ribosomal protein L29
MDFDEIKNKSAADLKELILEWRAKMRDLKFKAASGGLKKVDSVAVLRRDIARALTVLKDKK